MVTFKTTSTIFIHEFPNRVTSPVIKGISIGTQLNVLELLQQPSETWCKIADGWILAWDGFWFGQLEGA